MGRSWIVLVDRSKNVDTHNRWRLPADSLPLHLANSNTKYIWTEANYLCQLLIIIHRRLHFRPSWLCKRDKQTPGVKTYSNTLASYFTRAGIRKALWGLKLFKRLFEHSLLTLHCNRLCCSYQPGSNKPFVPYKILRTRRISENIPLGNLLTLHSHKFLRAWIGS